MKRFATSLLALVCLAAGGARWLDLVNCTDLATGFSTYGSYWVRYAVVGAVLLLAALASFLAPGRPAALGGHNALQGILAFLCGFGFAALAGVQIGGWAALGWVERTLAVLYLVSALGMLH